jgi:hypothetical protein
MTSKQEDKSKTSEAPVAADKISAPAPLPAYSMKDNHD